MDCPSRCRQGWNALFGRIQEFDAKQTLKHLNFAKICYFFRIMITISLAITHRLPAFLLN